MNCSCDQSLQVNSSGDWSQGLILSCVSTFTGRALSFAGIPRHIRKCVLVMFSMMFLSSGCFLSDFVIQVRVEGCSWLKVSLISCSMLTSSYDLDAEMI